MKVGPGKNESMAIFNHMMETCKEALAVLDNLRDMHKHKNSLRVATRMFNKATAMKP